MHTIYVNTSPIRFPRKCPHCGRKAEGSYAVAAMQGIAAYMGGYTVPPLLDVPVCRDIFTRRRAVALFSLVLTLVVILTAIIAAVVFAWRGWWPSAAVCAAVAVGLGAAGRTGWEAALADRLMLGLYARSVSSTRLRISIRDDKYFAEWKGMNRSASAEA